MLFTITMASVAVVSGFLTAWSLVRLITHRIREHKAGVAIHARLRPTAAFSRFKEPLLPLSAEAAHLPETTEMMSSYWKSGLFGLVFLASGGIFAFSALIMYGLWLTA